MTRRFPIGRMGTSICMFVVGLGLAMPGRRPTSGNMGTDRICRVRRATGFRNDWRFHCIRYNERSLPVPFEPRLSSCVTSSFVLANLLPLCCLFFERGKCVWRHAQPFHKSIDLFVVNWLSQLIIESALLFPLASITPCSRCRQSSRNGRKKETEEKRRPRETNDRKQILVPRVQVPHRRTPRPPPVPPPRRQQH